MKKKLLRFFLSVFFFKLLPKFSGFINSDDCIGKITSKSIRLETRKDLNLIERNRKAFPQNAKLIGVLKPRIT